MKSLLNSLFVFLFFLLFTAEGLSAQGSCNQCEFNPPNRHLIDVYTNPQVLKAQNIIYTKNGAPNPQYLDYYFVGNDPCLEKPLIIYFPGSGFLINPFFPITSPVNSPKDQPIAEHIAKFFARKGFVVAVVNYRREYPAHVTTVDKFHAIIHEAAQDVNAAIHEMVSANVLDPSLNIDPLNIFIIGESAGGLAALSSLFSDLNGNLLQAEIPSTMSPLPDYALTAKSKPLVGDATYSIRGFAGISTATPTKGIFTNRTRNIDLPMLFIHSDSDRTVPFTHDTSRGIFNIFPLLPRGQLAKQCGPLCIKTDIIATSSSNCFKLDEIGGVNVPSPVHNLMGTAYRDVLFLNHIKNFFYKQLNCNTYTCADSHDHYPALPIVNLPYNLRIRSQNTFEESFDKEAKEISFFPNPANEVINFRPDNERYSYQVSIHSIDGKLIHSQELLGSESSMDVSALPAGLYLLYIDTGEKVQVEKVVIR